METSTLQQEQQNDAPNLKNTFDSAIAIELSTLSTQSPTCNEEQISLNFKVSTALDSPNAAEGKSYGDEFYDSEKFKNELLLKAEEFFNSNCVKIEQFKNASTIEQVFLPAEAEENEEKIKDKKIQTHKTEKGVSINIDGEFDVLLEHIEGLNTSKIANEKCNKIKLCSNFDTSSKAIVVSSLESLRKILNMPAFDPHAPPIKFKIRRALSLQQIGERSDKILIYIPMESVNEYMKSKEFNPLNETILAKHEEDEFCSFCSCSECLSYREVVVHMMMEQFKASHMVVLLLDALLKAYSPLLRNDYALQHFEKLLEINKDYYWLATGLIYNKKYEELDFIYDETLTDPMILVLFSSILMINSPMQLLQMLAFHISCVVEAFAFGVSEVSVEEKLIYIIDGFDLLCDISDQISSYFVIFERNFLCKFSLTWLWLCQRLFQQHVYVRFFVAITNSGESLKNDDPLKQRYSEFVKRMLYLDMCWSKIIWPKLQKFNLTEAECKRRSSMVAVHKLFNALIEDVLRLPIKESNDDNVFEDLQLKDRRLLWQNILAFAKMRWPDGFCSEPNVLIYDYRCEKCGSVCMEHKRCCKCITCSIGGIPLLQTKNNICKECGFKEKEFKKDNNKIETDKKQQHTGAGEHEEQMEESLSKPNTITGKLQREIKKIITSKTPTSVIQNDYSELEPDDVYHVSWAVFKHFTQRKLYVRDKIDEKFFCKDCKMPACMLARRLLNNEIAPELTKILMSHFNPLPMLQSELRGIFPDIFFFNPLMFASHYDCSLHNTVVKAYWTLIISIYATFFIDFEKPCPLNLNALEIHNSDVKVVAEKLKGNNEDLKFLGFLDTIRSSSPTDSKSETAQGSSVQKFKGNKKLDEFLKPTRKNPNSKIPLRISTESLRTLSTAIDTGDINNDAVTVQPTSSNSIPGECDETQQKRSCTPKSKKCCLEHAADFGAEHCRENHARKRLKKDCNHARINETRDRLRKKLQDVKKNQQQMQTQTQIQQTTQISSPQKLLKDIPSRTTATATTLNSTESDISTRGVTATRKLMPISPATTPVSGTNTPQSIENVDDSEQVIGKVMEICDMLDNNKQKMKKWLDETLTYIEGYASSSTPTTTVANKKRQPQTKDPKKAAKKAKQKMRKEEEKRIAELHEIRDQFQDIYFKEFMEKIELKTLKNSGTGNNGANINAKRRCEKKKIAEIEANIKKLQRAKAKLESNILELIATVKQTNTEFKFTYLPTKEQQQAKLQELAESSKTTASGEATPTTTTSTTLSTTTTTEPIQSDTAAAFMNYNYMPSYTKFYPNISFPYEMSFPGNAAPPPPPYGLVSHQTLSSTAYGGNNNSNCYKPPPQQQQQTLSPNVMAALAANEKSVNNSNSDPSKRIVTIRRVHNPDMPDSQVTVTARGGSHGKEKLLYTFVNGTMVPTTAAMAMNESEHQTVNQQTSVSATTTTTKKETESTAAQLNKSQLKKERRRLAKLEKLAQDLAISDCEEDELMPMLPQTLPTKVKHKNSKSLKEGRVVKEVRKTNKKQLLTKVFLEDSTTSTQSGKKENVNTKVNEKEKCSVAKQTPNSALLQTTKKNKKKTQQQTIFQDEKQKETENHKNLKNVKKQEDKQLQKLDSVVCALTAKISKSQTKTKTTEPPTKIIKSEEITQPTAIESETKEVVKQQQQQRRHRRQKLVNHGQFDNNPYKSLHMLDSDTELDVTASSCDETEEEHETAEIMHVVLEQQKIIIKKEKSKSKEKSIGKVTTTAQCTVKNRTKGTQTSIIESANKSDTKQNRENVKAKAQNNKQQQNKNENGAIKRQLGEKQQQQQPQGKQTTNSHQISNSERQRIDCKSKKQMSTTQTIATQRGNKNQDQASTANSSRVANIRIPSEMANTKRENKHATIKASTSQQQQSNDSNKPPAAIKRAQRTRKKQLIQPQQQQLQLQSPFANYTDCGAGIPMRMEYFNPNEVNIPSLHQQQKQQQHQPLVYQQQQLQYENLTRQFQSMQISNSAASRMLPPSYASVSATTTTTTTSNVSIMDQLNRGVQVENLSLPPGITLTKVDPIKSEQLRQKSESIKRLSQPLHIPNNNNNRAAAYHHHHQHSHGPTIIAAPPTSGYLPSHVSSSTGGNIIMVEAMKPKPLPIPNSAAIAAAATASSKASSKSKRRRNKGKRSDCSPRDSISTNASSNNNDSQQNKMVTLRNPMFHAGPAAAAASVLKQPAFLAGHHGITGSNTSMPMAPPLPMDQPAAIIKNENGMFTIRNPALHQAVTNGLGGYRQFGGNVNYYTPQEAAAEAAKSQQHQQQMQQQQSHANISHPIESFSYFSNNTSKPLTNDLIAKPTKTISITCTTIDAKSKMNNESDSISQLKENTTPSPIARPSSSEQRCISAIGSEIKQNRNSANAEHMWSEYRQQQQLDLPQPQENSSNASTSLLGSTLSDGSNNQRTEFYNGYGVFSQRSENSHISQTHSTPAAGATSSTLSDLRNQIARSPNQLFETPIGDSMTSQHLSHHHHHHNCGDDSPPPTSLLGNSSKYLDGISATGVVRYDDASFLKKLIPGQRLNKEVSIHNINESSFGRPPSPKLNRIVITPVYSGSSNKVSPSSSLDLQSQRAQQHYRQTSSSSPSSGLTAAATAYSGAKPSSFNDYDQNTAFASSVTDNTTITNNIGNISHHHEQSYQPFGYDAFDTSALSTKQKSITDLNNLFSTNFKTPSPRDETYLDESFVQNLNSLQLSSSEQCAQQQLNGKTLKNNGLMGNANNAANSSGWWC